MPTFDVSISIKLKDSRVTEFFLVRTQRANEVTQVFGQHGDSTVNEIDTGSTLHGFLVDNSAFLDVMAHVSYVDANFPQALLNLAD